MALRILALALPVAGSVYQRPLDIVFALSGGQGLPYTDTQLFQYLDQVQPPITAVVPFLLNVGTPSRYNSTIQGLQDRNITIVPAVGGSPDDGDIDSKQYRNIAEGYRAYTDYIRLENMQGYYDGHGEGGIQNMINYCVRLGFRHIMLNPWPQENGGAAVPFKNAQLDASIYQVLLEKNNTSHEPIPNPTNWYPGNQDKIKAVRALRPDIELLINYEAAPQQEVLAQLEHDEKGGSIAAMQITIDQINGQFKSGGLHWIPPVHKVYDAIALGTWDWIAEELSKN